MRLFQRIRKSQLKDVAVIKSMDAAVCALRPRLRVQRSQQSLLDLGGLARVGLGHREEDGTASTLDYTVPGHWSGLDGDCMGSAGSIASGPLHTVDHENIHRGSTRG